MWSDIRQAVGVAVIVPSLLLGPAVPPATEASTVPVSVEAAPAAAIDWELQAELEEYLADREGLYGVAARSLETGQTVMINADRSFLSASTYKVLVMYLVYEQLESGALSADDVLTISWSDAVEEDPEGGLYPGQAVTAADALEAMITISSNVAAHRLTRLVGGWGQVYATAQELGMSGTYFQGEYFRTTPEDMLTFFQALAEGRLVSPSASWRMICWLGRQQVNDRIPALLPDWAFAPHKTGELPGVRNDVGIVYGPNGSYVIAIFSRWADVDEATWVGARVSRLVYDRYAG